MFPYHKIHKHVLGFMLMGTNEADHVLIERREHSSMLKE